MKKLLVFFVIFIIVLTPVYTHSTAFANGWGGDHDQQQENDRDKDKDKDHDKDRDKDKDHDKDKDKDRDKDKDKDKEKDHDHNRPPVCEHTPTPTPTPVLDCTATPEPTATPTVAATSTPEPTNSPEPTNTPAPQSGKSTKFEMTAVGCNNWNFDAKVWLTDNGVAAKNVEVEIEYQGETKKATTNDDGYLQIGFAFNGVAQVRVKPANDYPYTDARIDDPQNCSADTGEVGIGGVATIASSNNPAPQGQILGVSTMADTGIFDMILTRLMEISGGIMTVVGSALYAQKKTKVYTKK